jgi:tetratricopeptide (TPR) repeat protein
MLCIGFGLHNEPGSCINEDTTGHAMAYVRTKGNQLAIVHGERDKQSGSVQQRTLFTIYSKAEALAAIGKPDTNSSYLFQNLLEGQYPELRFDWKSIRTGIRDNLGVLPDLYEYKRERIEKRFGDDLTACVRQLFLADPQHLVSAARLIQSHRAELALLAELIQWRVGLCEQQEGQFNQDNPFYWRLTMQGPGAPFDAQDFVTGYFDRGEYLIAEAGFRLLVDAFPRYADGFNYLGLIALEQERFDDAVECFQRTIEVGRALFPKRIGKKRYWRDLVTRPYMRGLRNLTLTLNQIGRFEDALLLCERLKEECGDDVSAHWHCATIALNQGRWDVALDNASFLTNIHPEAGFIHAFAAHALGHRQAALGTFLHATLHYPRAAKMLSGVRLSKPTRDEARDHNEGLSLRRALHAYVARPPRGARAFFKTILSDKRVKGLVDEVLLAERRWQRDRSGTNPAAFKRMQLMRSKSYAESEARRLVDLAGSS